MGNRKQIDQWDNEGGAPPGQHQTNNAPSTRLAPRAAQTRTTTEELPNLDKVSAAITQATVAITQKYVAQARAASQGDVDSFERSVSTLVHQQNYISEMTAAIMAIVQPLVTDEDDADAASLAQTDTQLTAAGQQATA